MKPEISVIMPVYNCKQYIFESIKSICNQTFENWELIIINDNSIENIEEEIKKIQDDRIHYHAFVEHEGLFNSLEYGLQQAQGDFITFHDPDDISSPTRFNEQLNYLKSNDDLGMVSCLIRCFTNDTSYRNACTFIEKIQNAYISREQIENAIINKFSPVIFPTIMMRRSLLDGIEFHKEENELEDYFQIFLYLLKQGRLEKVNSILYYYRRHKNSYHIQNEKNYSETVQAQLSKSGIQNFIKYRELYKDLKKEQYIVSRSKKDSPLRILMLIDALNIGGTEMYVLELAKSLEKLGAHVVIGTSGGPLVEVFQHYGLKVVKIPFTSDYISNKDIMKLIKLTKKIIDEEKINLLHCHLFASMRLGNDIYRSYKIPYIVTLHGLFYPNDVLFESCINATKIIAVSEPIKKLIKSKLSSRIRGELVVIPNGIDMENFHPQDTVKGFKNQLGIPENSQIITYCSRLDWGKTFAAEAFIFACFTLMAKNKYLHAFVIGDGADKNLITHEVNILNKMLKRDAIHVVGAKFNVLPYYQNADIVVGTARVALEAMSCGKPVIAVGNHGYTGIINPRCMNEQWSMYFGDHDSIKKVDSLVLAKDLNELLQNTKSCKYLEKWGRRWCEKKFDSELVAKDIFNLYQEVLSEKEVENTDKENMPNKIETDIQTKESLLLEKTSSIISRIPDGIEFTPEISEVVLGSNNALARYCTHCTHCRFDITMPFTIILKDKKDSCKTLTVPDLLHIELNSYNYNNCIHKQDCECGALINLINKCGMRIENEIKNKPIIDKHNQYIIFEIITRIYVNFCDPGILDLEAGIYGSGSIIGEDNPLVKDTGKDEFKKNIAAEDSTNIHHEPFYCYEDDNSDYDANSLMRGYPYNRP
ncbi:glycosyl transferase [Clostridium botulinum B2 267]|uniref:glycosyltransferase n=1 Tax=Clostridium botulinum TaxID=1491 RepID=UPI0007E00BE8|nr:glycosyltransferase [Clostridium botulinum]KEI87343.1 glycosyl transferase [Clostridium botulinum B2 267]